MDLDPYAEEVRRKLLADDYPSKDAQLVDAVEVFCSETLRDGPGAQTALDVATRIIARHLWFGETLEPGKQPYVRFPAAYSLAAVLNRTELRDLEVRRFLISRVRHGFKVGEAILTAANMFPVSTKTAEAIWGSVPEVTREALKAAGKERRNSLKKKEKMGKKSGETLGRNH